MTRAARRRLRALRHRTGIALLTRGGRVAWSTECLIDANCRVRLAAGSVIHGAGLVVLLEGSTLELGSRSTVMRCAELSLGEGSTLTIGPDTYIGSHANLRVDGELHIGAEVLLAQFVSVISGQYDHRSSRQPAARLPTLRGQTIIEDGAWIGANAAIVSGVRVGRGAVIGAGSVVTREVPPFAIAAGVPAHVIGERGAEPFPAPPRDPT